MSSRVPMTYSRKVLELFRNPKNLGRMEDASAEAMAGSLACGDMIAIYLKVEDGTERILNAKFESYGCAANIAAASTLTEMVKGKTLMEAWRLSWKDISEELGGLPFVKFHCGVLAIGAMRRAIRAYYKDRPQPEWLPKEFTPEERQALEEEKLLEVLERRVERMKTGG
ncbi:MAG: iron-sulfur cluster assembly scaffold protein [Candidatus Bathyarchaeia archaeon]|nr:iron-sulfur cluster assembly scaffold protein [Candidatus Bathyarchaeota archaeon]